MSVRFQKRISLGKYMQLNLSKSGVGMSAGIPGLRLTTGVLGTHLTVGLPGTGLSYRKKIGGAMAFAGLAVSSPERGLAKSQPSPKASFHRRMRSRLFLSRVFLHQVRKNRCTLA